MNKEEILSKSRKENKKKDLYQEQVMDTCFSWSTWVIYFLATLFFAVQIFTGNGINYGLYAIVFSVNMTSSWVKYFKFHEKEALPGAICHTIFILLLSTMHIYNLVV